MTDAVLNLHRALQEVAAMAEYAGPEAGKPFRKYEAKNRKHEVTQADEDALEHDRQYSNPRAICPRKHESRAKDTELAETHQPPSRNALERLPQGAEKSETRICEGCGKPSEPSE